MPATAALMTMFALSGGPYMTFVGGEVGIEDQVRAVHRIRRELPHFGRGSLDPAGVEVDDETVYAVVRRLDPMAGLLMVNLSDRTASVRVRLSTDVPFAGTPGTARFTTPDHLGGPGVTWSRADDDRWSADVVLAPWGSVALTLTG